MVAGGEDDCSFRGIVAVETALGYAGASSNVVHRRITETSFGEHFKGTSRQAVWHLGRYTWHGSGATFPSKVKVPQNREF
jgi:hypothetical protein